MTNFRGETHYLTTSNMQTRHAVLTASSIMLISIYDITHPSPRTAASPSQQSVAAYREIPAQLSQVQVHRSRSIKKPHVDNSLLRKYIMHLCTHTVFGLTLTARRTPSTPAEDAPD